MMRKLTRILSIVFILFISMFALDVFGEEQWFLALLIHLIPSFILMVVTIVSWKREFLGGILWLILGISFMIMSLESWIVYVPAMVIGGLNLWLGRRN